MYGSCISQKRYILNEPHLQLGFGTFPYHFQTIVTWEWMVHRNIYKLHQHFRKPFQSPWRWFLNFPLSIWMLLYYLLLPSSGVWTGGQIIWDTFWRRTMPCPSDFRLIPLFCLRFTWCIGSLCRHWNDFIKWTHFQHPHIFFLSGLWRTAHLIH